MSIFFTADENGKATPTVAPPPRISHELAAKIAAEIVDYMRPAETPYIADLLIPNIAEIIERVGNESV